MDRILIASGRVEGMTIVTADRSILDHPHVSDESILLEVEAVLTHFRRGAGEAVR